MKIATIIIRTLIGLLLLFASISYFFHLITEPPLKGNMKLFNDGIKASVYLMPLVKTVELLIICTHIFLAPEGIPVAAFLFLGNIFLIYTKWDNYKGLFVA
jgi:putative oxidoreductase